MHMSVLVFVIAMSSIYVYVSEQVGISVPGNDVMSAVVLLFIEVLSYAIIIFVFIMYYMCRTIDMFTLHGNVVPFDSVGYQTSYINTLPKSVVQLFMIERNSELRYPGYFAKSTESVLDAIFLVIPTIVVAMMLNPCLAFLYSYDAHLGGAGYALFEIDVVGHQ